MTIFMDFMISRVSTQTRWIVLHHNENNDWGWLYSLLCLSILCLHYCKHFKRPFWLFRTFCSELSAFLSTELKPVNFDRFTTLSCQNIKIGCFCLDFVYQYYCNHLAPRGRGGGQGGHASPPKAWQKFKEKAQLQLFALLCAAHE